MQRLNCWKLGFVLLINTLLICSMGCASISPQALVKKREAKPVEINPALKEFPWSQEFRMRLEKEFLVLPTKPTDFDSGDKPASSK